MSRLARECGVNANQVSRWLREHRNEERIRVAEALSTATGPFVALRVARAESAPATESEPALVPVDLKAVLPNGVAIEAHALDPRLLAEIIAVLGRLRCSESTRA